MSTGPIAFVTDRDGTEQIYLANADGSAVRRLTPGAAPAWSRDGQRLAFYRAQEIYVINVDRSGLQHLAGGWEPDWSPRAIHCLP
jgi:Tol biopolymer transport system component